MSDHARVERLAATLARMDPTYLNALERLLERLPQAPQIDGKRQELDDECDCSLAPAPQAPTGGRSRTKIFINPDITENVGLLSLVLEAAFYAEPSARSKPQLQSEKDYDLSNLPPDFWEGAPNDIEFGSTRSLATSYGVWLGEIFSDEEPF